MKKEQFSFKGFLLVVMIITNLLFSEISFAQTVIQNPSGSWMVPENVYAIKVEVWGGGGGGGGAYARYNQTHAGGGGGGGAYSAAYFAVSPGQIYSVTIGAGGSPGASSNYGGVGGTTLFTGAAGTISVNGGVGGAAGRGGEGTGGAGGTGGMFNGGTGGTSTGYGAGGGGGAGNASAGNAGANDVTGTGGLGNPDSAPYVGGNGGSFIIALGPGTAGSAPGGGGGGARINSGGYFNTGTAIGGAGGQGQVLISYDFASPIFTTTAGSLAFGYVENGSTSEVLSYQLAGFGLTPQAGNITIAAPPGFEVSTSVGSGFNSSIIVPYTHSALVKDIFVRFAPSGSADYNGTISNSGGGAPSAEVSISGTSVFPASACNFDNNANSSIIHTPCINIPSNEQLVGQIDYQQYFVMDIIKGLNYTIRTNSSPAGGNGYQLTLYNESTQDYFVSSNSNTGNSSGNTRDVFLAFTAPFSGQVRALFNERGFCSASADNNIPVYADVIGGSNTFDNQAVAGTDSWIGHIYEGSNTGIAYNGNYPNYLGNYTQTETFTEIFGSETVDNYCFSAVNSNSVPRASVLNTTFTVKYRMNSTKHGLFAFTLGFDDAARLLVDGAIIWDNWPGPYASTRTNVMMNLTGSSTLLLDCYETTGSNRLSFQNLTLLLSNTLAANVTQNVCLGQAGANISGDSFGALPSGISLSGTGYQWAYSTSSADGPWTDIPGATSSAYTPSSATAPFNATGTYYIIRKAKLASANNNPPYWPSLILTNLSNVARFSVNPVGSWTGAVNTSWSESGNWCGSPPDAGADVYIPSFMDNQPHINGVVTCNSLTINPGASIIIESGGKLDVVSTITNNNGNDGLVIKDGGSLITNSPVHGTVERTISAVNQWHLVSSPVSAISLGSVFPLDTWVKRYNEADQSWVYLNQNTQMTVGKGYSVWLTGSNLSTYTGIITAGDKKITGLSKNDFSTDVDYNGWNLIGNPFPSALYTGFGSPLDWGLVNVDPYVYVWNGGNYLSQMTGTYMGSAQPGLLTDGIIPAQQGFFVHVNTTGSEGEITIPQEARVHSNQPYYKTMQVQPPHLKFDVDGSGFNDRAAVYFLDQATSGFEGNLDAYKLSGIEEAPQLWFPVDAHRLSINMLPVEFTELSVPLSFRAGSAKEYILKVDGIESIDIDIPIFLFDKKQGITRDLRLNNTYSFSAATGEDENRFSLSFSTILGVKKQALNNLSIYGDHGKIVVNNSENYTGIVQIYNANGQLITNLRLQPGLQKTDSLPRGVYFVKAVAGKTNSTKKVIVF